MSSPLRWDLFCAVIDHYGDIGVAWRLARQLAGEYGFAVRLWVDDPNAFRRIEPLVRPAMLPETIRGVEVVAWKNDEYARFGPPGDVIIETFGCRPPDKYLDAAASRPRKPVWINLEYLSAEDWIEACHRLPSPHPSRPLSKHFFFPGFTRNTGGLLRERDLARTHRRFLALPRDNAWQMIGFPPPEPDALIVFLFTYEHAAIADLLSAWANGTTRVCCLVAPPNAPQVARHIGSPAPGWRCVRRACLEARFLSDFIPQTEFDTLLWLSDISFVRGEDSFVRAQWAAKPFIWTIYPQENNAHLAKLDAFLDRYGRGLSDNTFNTLRALHHGWNTGHLSRPLWPTFLSALPELRRHASRWAESLQNQPDLCHSLVRFCLSQL